MSSWILFLASLHMDRRVPLGLDVYMPVPLDNPLTSEKVALGRRLFFDRRLSRSGVLSCASCHNPKHAFTDGRAVSIGVLGRRGSRNAPTLVNRGYGGAHFWDGRASSLEKQVLEPIFSRNELDMTQVELQNRLRLSPSEVANALASYVRSIRSGESPYDRYLAGDGNALNAQQRRGLALFRGKANCSACHIGPNLTDESFHNTGIAWRSGRLQDEGRFAVTRQASDQGSFKTPTLREISRTAPYMHDGGLATIDQVIEHYDRGGIPNPHLDTSLRPLRLAPDEKQALASFLRALSGRISEGR